MKQAVYLGKESIEIRDVPVPECGDDDILVKNIRSSICGTDVAVYSHGPRTGHRVTIGGEFGHETVSRVVKTGKNITDVKEGDRIYPYPLYWSKSFQTFEASLFKLSSSKMLLSS